MIKWSPEILSKIQKKQIQENARLTMVGTLAMSLQFRCFLSFAPSNLITHLVLSPSCQKPDIIYVFALCKLLGLSQKRGTTMKKQLSHHIKLEGVQSKFKL